MGQFSRFSLGPALYVCSLLATPVWAGPFTSTGHLPEDVVAWATVVDDFEVGLADIAIPEFGPVGFGSPESVLGPSLNEASGVSQSVFSLGDGGFITVGFEQGIGNGPGNDFAVFENGFLDNGSDTLFGEFAFVEVSTNGVDFIRFPTISLRVSPVSGFEFVDPSDYLNFAGDQPEGVGTGFDLSELINDPLVSAGLVDLADIQFVRLIDVVGDGSTLDGMGQAIFDPYPTVFVSGGFDAEAVGILNPAPEPGFVSMLSIGCLAFLMRSKSIR